METGRAALDGKFQGLLVGNIVGNHHRLAIILINLDE